MEVGHFVGIGVALVVSVILLWIVWSFFCEDKKGHHTDSGEIDPGESDSFSSTHVITTRRKSSKSKKTRPNSASSCNETTDDESEAERINKQKHCKSKKERRSSYLYQQNRYGLDDPFAEWKPQEKQLKQPNTNITAIYPKSPKLNAKVNHSTVIDV